MQSHKFRAMNSEIVLMAEGYPARVLEGFEVAESFIHASEQRFTRFSENSELSRLNNSAGGWFSASTDLFELISESLRYYKKTGGLFDPSVLVDLKRAGYDRSMDEIRRIGPAPKQADYSRGNLPSFDMIKLNPSNSGIFLPKGLQVDLGGIAKGWIAHHAAILLSECSNACAVSAGGDMFLIGTPSGFDYWEVGLEDPLRPGDDITILRVGEGAVATSSVAKRAWVQGETPRHHLIDPRSHEPAQSDWLSVTVIAPEILVAETFAKSALIGGVAFVKQCLAENRDITFLAVDRDGQFIDLQEIDHVNQ